MRANLFAPQTIWCETLRIRPIEKTALANFPCSFHSRKKLRVGARPVEAQPWTWWRRLARPNDLTCVCAPWFRLMAASLFAVSKAFARTSKASTVMPPIELKTDMGRLEKLQMGMSFRSFQHRARTDVDVRRNTERRRKPPDSGTERGCFILSKPPKTKRSSIITAEGDRLAKNHPNPVAEEYREVQKIASQPTLFGRDSVKTLLISRYFWILRWK